MNKLIETMTNGDYHAIDALSSTGLKYLAQSPAHFLEYKKTPPTQTSAMLIGSAVHAAFLENQLDKLVVKAPGSTRSTNLYKDFIKANPGAICLLEDEYADVAKITEALASHSLVSELVKDGKPEVSAFWTDPETGIECKCRPDYLRNDGVVIDLKTTQDASAEEFQRAIGSYKYHWQTAWYLDGMSLILEKPLENFIHIAVEKTAPFGIGVYVLDNESIDKARQDIKFLKERYAECLHTGVYPTYKAEIQNLSIPLWLFNKELAS